jgi:hypothetical protein
MSDLQADAQVFLGFAAKVYLVISLPALND